MSLNKNERRARRKKSIRSRISGTLERPRLTVFKSLKNIYAQIIDDMSGKTLLSCSTMDKEYKGPKGCNIESAKAVGKLLADKAIKNKIETVLFDRNGYVYHGKIKALADACRENGLKF